MLETLPQWAGERGYRIAWGPLSVAQAARADVATRHRTGELNSDFYTGELTKLGAEGKPPWDGPATIVMVAKPRPAHIVTFNLPNRTVEAVLPPTYVRYRPVFEEVRQDLQTHGLPGARVVLLEGPLKATAVRLGLVKYGLNNITYAPDLGSYIQLLGYVTDAPLPLPRNWHPNEPDLMSECESCGACQSACPTGAIDPARVLLRAERCLTLANEMDTPWPTWLPSNIHHCLLGCLFCQENCPKNPPLKRVSTGVVFTHEETLAFLEPDSERVGTTWDSIRAKLDEIGESSYENVLGRNLRALLESQQSSPNS